MYESFYNLTAKPFRLNPDPRFFFNSRGHKRALAYLRYGVKQGEGFIIVTGDVGTGKSTLVGALFEALKNENIVAAQIVTTQVDADDLLRMVAASFGLPFEHETKAGLLRQIEGFFRACAAEGKRILLVIDEAQGLPKAAIEELRMLSNFQMNGRSLLQSFLLGQREFRTTMRTGGFEQLRQRVIAAYHLKPLEVGETREYIEHRLRLAGWDNDPTFAPGVFDRVHDFTRGVPRRINTLVDRLLLFGYLEEKHHIDVETLRTVAEDIMEEQGGLVMDHEGGGFGAAGNLSDIDFDRPEGMAPSPPAPVSEPGEQRIAAVEQSMSSLTDAVRRELATIREALIAGAPAPAAAAGPEGASPGPGADPSAAADTVPDSDEPGEPDGAQGPASESGTLRAVSSD